MNVYRRTKELREFERLLSKNGYKYARSRGSHFVYINRVSHRLIVVNKDLNDMVKRRLIKEYELEE